MKNASLKVGQHLTLNNEMFEILRVKDEMYQLENQKDFSLKSRTKLQLLKALESGELKFSSSGNNLDDPAPMKGEARDLSSYSLTQQRIAKKKMDYINNAINHFGERPCYLNLDRVIPKVSSKLRDPTPPSQMTLYRWWRTWEKSGRDITSLVPKERKSGYATRKFSKQVLSMLGDIVYDDYFKEESFTVQDAYDRLKYLVNEHNKKTVRELRMPSRPTVFRYFSKLDRYDVLLAKKGKRFAKQALRATGQGIYPNFILGRVEIDHTPLDLFIVDEKSFQVIGRPNLTCLVDKFSRVILGFSLSFEPPSELSIIRALRQAIFPKATLNESYPDLSNEWLSHGIPITLVADNGLEFHSHMLRQLCYELNIELVFCPKKEPQFKGCVERTLGTLNRQTSHRCAGTSFSNVNERADYKSVDRARLTLKEANDLITQWIVDVYHQKRHSITRYTPDYLWKEGLISVEPRLPESKDAFDLASSRPYNQRRLAHDGIQFLYLSYNSSDMQTIRRNSVFEGKVDIRVNHEDLGFIWVHDQANDEFIKVPCTHMDYASGLTLLQHQKILEEKKLDSDQQFDEENYLEGKEKLRQKINELNSDRLLRERKKGARIAMKQLAQRPEIDEQPDSPRLADETRFSDLGEIPQFESHQIGGQ